MLKRQRSIRKDAYLEEAPGSCYTEGDRCVEVLSWYEGNDGSMSEMLSRGSNLSWEVG